ncbi:ferrous iron transport protein A, partial [Vibrio lentus]
MKLSQLEQGKAASIVALTGLTPEVRK